MEIAQAKYVMVVHKAEPDFDSVSDYAPTKSSDDSFRTSPTCRIGVDSCKLASISEDIGEYLLE